MAEVCLPALWSLIGLTTSWAANGVSIISKLCSCEFVPWDIALGVLKCVH